MSDAPRGSVWVVVGVFALVGPLIGGMLFGAVAMLERSGGAGWQDVLSLPLAAPMGYLFGLLPAFLTGVVSGVLSSRIDSKSLWVALGTISGGALSAFTALQIPGFWVYMGPIGAASAFGCALIALQVRPRWRN